MKNKSSNFVNLTNKRLEESSLCNRNSTVTKANPLILKKAHPHITDNTTL